MKSLPRALLFGVLALLVLSGLAIASWRYLLRSDQLAGGQVEKLKAGAEINALKNAEAEPPNDGEIVAVPCKSQTRLAANESMVGRPGAFLKILANGEMKQSSGEELAFVHEAFDPAANDAVIPLKTECAEDVEEADGAITWYVSTLKTDQFFSTKKGVRVETQITEKDRLFFQTKLNPSCVVQEVEEGAPTPDCVRPQVIGITDLNGNGKREFWFNEPYKWDMGVGVIEEPGQRILTACPGRAD